MQGLSKEVSAMLIFREIKIFLASIAFLTRIPVPLSVESIASIQHKTPRYYPYAGWIIGGISSAVYIISSLLFSNNISIIFSMMASIFITGAFHEDGLMDFVDGFGGGYTKDGILRIMKDPRSGSYGVIAVVMILLLKYSLLSEIKSDLIPFVLIYSHSLSRFFSISLLPWMDYVRIDGKSSFIGGRIKFRHLFFASLGGFAPLLFFQEYEFVLIFPAVVIPVVLFAFYIKNKIGGYTGDCLGALQQVSEVIIYILFIINGTVLF